jgi:hypothetical protein
MWWRVPVIPATWEVETGGLHLRLAWAKSMRPYLRKKLKEKSRGRVQVAELLTSKSKILSSSSSTKYKEKNNIHNISL